MNKFTRHCGIAAPMLQDNIDTDAIIPSREMKAVSKHGLGEGLFAGQRYLCAEQRDINPEFVLNQDAYANATILLSGRNFGCGSSREHAAWALKEFGIRAIIAQSFGSIFFGNCTHNGLLPVVLEADEIEALNQASSRDPAANTILVDLESQQVCCAGLVFSFELDAEARAMLLQGLDPIGLTLLQEPAILQFEKRDRLQRPWAYRN